MLFSKWLKKKRSAEHQKDEPMPPTIDFQTFQTQPIEEPPKRLMGTEKALPSGTPFFIMVEMNWSMHLAGTTDHREYYVYSDGRVEYQYNGFWFNIPFEERSLYRDNWSGLRTTKMTDEDFLSLCDLLKKFPENHAYNNCCDGTGYEMTLYDEEGNVIHTTCGYLYGNEVLEKICALLETTCVDIFDTEVLEKISILIKK